MNKVIKDIIEDKTSSTEEKINFLDELLKDIDLGKKILNREFKYCEDCDDYYLTKSFTEEIASEIASKEEKISAYIDPINSRGNEYIDEIIAIITYSVCPKGHKHEINKISRSERKK